MTKSKIGVCIVLVALAALAWPVFSQKPPAPKAGTPISGATERQEVAALVEKYQQRHQKWAVLTFVAYAGTFLISALANVFAAAVLKADTMKNHPRWKAVAFWVALAGAAAVTLNGTFGFGERWTDNRQSQAAIEELQIDLTDPSISAAAIRAKLKDIEVAHAKAKIASKIQ